MADAYATFHVGVNALVIRDEQLLLGKRKQVYGSGLWGLPGGHLEPGESILQGAARELEEETGLKATHCKFTGLFNNTKKNENSNKHYLQIGVLMEGVKGEPKLCEPDRCYEWKWFETSQLPEKIFTPHEPLITLFLEKRVFQDS